jgi:hypothetical protein
MKLITFTEQNTVSQRTTPCRIRFSRKGANSIGKSAVELMGFTKGNRVAIHQDQDCPLDWYISIDNEGWELYFKENALTFYSRPFSESMLNALHINERRI